jgi:hypothetical protein
MTVAERALHPANAGVPSSRGWVILALVVLCAVPPVIATSLYLAGWRPAHAVNHGVLIQPPPALPEISLYTADGAVTPLRSMRGRWLLIYAAPPGRPAAYRDMRRKLQQLHMALGAEGERLQSLLILPAPARMAPAQPRDGVLVVKTTSAERASLAVAFGAAEGSMWRGRYIYLADPLGHLIMRYPSDVTPGNVLADLKRLMTYSWVG